MGNLPPLVRKHCGWGVSQVAEVPHRGAGVLPGVLFVPQTFAGQALVWPMALFCHVLLAHSFSTIICVEQVGLNTVVLSFELPQM